MAVTTKATIASFRGKLLKCAHNASTTNCEMAFNLYLPPQATTNSLHKVPLLIYLAGLTCTGDNGAEKGFFQHAASQKGIAVLYPDTSPRMFPTSLPHLSPNHCRIEPTFKMRTFPIKNCQNYLMGSIQADSKSQAKTTPTISAPAPASTSTRPKTPGPRAIKCTATSPPNSRRRSSPLSSKWMGQGLVYSGIAWAAMVP